MIKLNGVGKASLELLECPKGFAVEFPLQLDDGRPVPVRVSYASDPLGAAQGQPPGRSTIKFRVKAIEEMFSVELTVLILAESD